MNSIRDRYKAVINRIVSGAKEQKPVSETDVLQQGKAETLPLIDKILNDHMLPGSGIHGKDNLDALLEVITAKESCILLVEHYSNFDLPGLHYLLRKEGEQGAKIADALVSIAGIKLNESNPIVSAFADAYTRIVIYPSRSLEIIKKNFKDPNRLYHEIRRSISINRAAMKALGDIKKSGKVVLVFPAGTRYRPGDPGSKRGVREIASYLKSFTYYCLVSINGNILRINPTGEMEDDLLTPDTLVYTFGPVRKCLDLLAHVKEEHQFREDKKQEIVDHIMEELEMMHVEAEKKRSMH
jgi:glycerol-3-phosphate O-acyltransferase